MRKLLKIMTVCLLAVLLSACGNGNSKVDQVVQEQMQGTDDKAKQNEDTGVTDQANGTSAAQTNAKEENAYVREPDANVDVDLTALSSTMVYSEVYNMLVAPDDYIGKVVKMRGQFVAYSNEDQSMYYPAVIIADATACCSQGLEFLLEGNPPYPEGYPELETEITVVGTFETYLEDGNTFCRLQNAKIESE